MFYVSAFVGLLLGKCWLYVGLCWAHVRLYWSHGEASVPCWVYVGPSWAHVGPMLPCWAYVGPSLALCWAMCSLKKRGKAQDSRAIKAPPPKLKLNSHYNCFRLITPRHLQCISAFHGLPVRPSADCHQRRLHLAARFGLSKLFDTYNPLKWIRTDQNGLNWSIYEEGKSNHPCFLGMSV